MSPYRSALHHILRKLQTRLNITAIVYSYSGIAVSRLEFSEVLGVVGGF